MPITVNGEIAPIPEPPNLEALIRELAPRRPFAAALNGDFIPVAAFEISELNDGDCVEIVHPAAGG